jgi:hypothetical protein
MKFYTNLSVEEKNVMRENIFKIRDVRKEQIKLIEDALIKPLHDIVFASQSVRMGLISLDEFVKMNECAGARLDAVFKGVQNGNKK